MVSPPSDPAGSGLRSQQDHALTFSLGSIVFEMSQMLCCCSHVICCLSSCSCGVKMHLAARSRLALSAERSWESTGRWSGHRGGGMTAAIQWKEDIWIMPSLEETACVISSLFFSTYENMQRICIFFLHQTEMYEHFLFTTSFLTHLCHGRKDYWTIHYECLISYNIISFFLIEVNTAFELFDCCL